MRMRTALALPALAVVAIIGLAGTAAADGDAGNGNGDGTTATQTISGNSISDSAFLGHAFHVGNTGIQQTPVTVTFASIGG
ncbi:hypothetical protein OG782_32450 [Streptomyces sp. NBC_00876]|uniref:hypothetical protein n=1 Tax=Streptomyces sp. NBC_00876 TaxID=2975853 RepID=UPI00386B71AD|nr:hypothetical protein OG782_32450 [Streptomyces sp. NBC_00876]